MSNTARVVAAVASALWLASWFLPVIDGVSGGKAFLYALGDRDDADAAAHILSALTNLVFPVLAFFVLTGRASRRGLFIKVALACALMNSYWLVTAVRESEAAGLRIGYYAWLVAFALLVVSGVSIRRTSRTPTAGTPA